MYAFCRVSDDLSDEPGEPAVKRAGAARLAARPSRALEGDYSHPLHPALHDTVRRFAVPARHLEEIVDGVCMDLDVVRYPTFDELYRYCYHVASAVGLASIHVWGFAAPPHPPPRRPALPCSRPTSSATSARTPSRGRIYLPGEDLMRFGCDGSQFTHGVCDDRFRALMRFQTDRAYGYYARRGRWSTCWRRPARRCSWC
ncbi:MAG: squalene/phytoene synthase family protein [Gemmataceae bacterium]